MGADVDDCEVILIQKRLNPSCKTKELEVRLTNIFRDFNNNNSKQQHNMNLVSEKNKDLHLTIEDLQKELVLTKIALTKKNQALYNEGERHIMKLGMEKNMLDLKLVKKEEEISNLRKRIEEQEDLKTQLEKASSENKSFHKEIRKAISTMDENYQKGLDAAEMKTIAAEKEEEISKLRKRVGEQEDLKTQLDQANRENMSFHLVNREIRKAISTLHENYQKALDFEKNELEVKMKLKLVEAKKEMQE